MELQKCTPKLSSGMFPSIPPGLKTCRESTIQSPNRFTEDTIYFIEPTTINSIDSW
ncbi:hypothetical protein WN55_07994 [Dufourea novaeangliae]|uniref:Uncharacterized protein n=1 Tax=Dufourea novaeangliae TaxID=178035 RepID=A0A154P8J6_DUFNO|nr:hypothetical protein WN55_07994 [Dufourea novaeangliae]